MLGTFLKSFPEYRPASQGQTRYFISLCMSTSLVVGSCIVHVLDWMRLLCFVIFHKVHSALVALHKVQVSVS